MVDTPGVNTRFTADASQFDSELERSVQGLLGFETAAIGAGTAASRSGARVSAMGRALRSFRGHTNAVALQLQDIIVQMTMGTHWTTALGQNVPQLASAFGTLGSVIGVVAAIGFPALGVAISLAQGGMDNLGEEVENLTDLFEAYKTATEQASRSVEDLTEEFGTAAPIIKELYDALEEVARSQLEDKLQAIREELAEFGKMTSEGISNAYLASLFDLNIAFGKNRKAVRAMVAEFVAAREELNDRNATIEEQVAASTRLLGIARDLAETDGEITEEEQALLDLLKTQAETLARILGLSQRRTEEEAAAVKAEEERLKLYAKAAKAEEERITALVKAVYHYNDERTALERKIALQEAIAKYGEQDVRVAELRLQQERDVYAEKLRQAGLNEDQIKYLVKLLETSQRMRDSVDDTTSAMNRFSGAMQSAISWAQGLYDKVNSLSEPLESAMADFRFRVSIAGLDETEQQIQAELRNLRERLMARGQAAFGMNFELTKEQKQQLAETEAYLRANAPTLFPTRDEPPKRERRTGDLDRYQTQLAQLQEYLMTEEELLLASQQRQRDQLLLFLQQGLIDRAEYKAMEMQLEQQHADELMRLHEQTAAMTLGNYSTLFGNLATVFEAGGKKMVGIARLASIAQGLLNSYLAYTEVLKDPALTGQPWLRQALAASTLAAGLAQVASMRSTNYGTTSGSASGAASAPVSAPSVSRNVAIQLTGGDMFSRDQVINLINSINEAVEDGAIVRLV